MARASAFSTTVPSDIAAEFAAMTAVSVRYRETQLFRPLVDGALSLDEVERLIDRAIAYRDAILIRRAS